MQKSLHSVRDQPTLNHLDADSTYPQMTARPSNLVDLARLDGKVGRRKALSALHPSNLLTCPTCFTNIFLNSSLSPRARTRVYTCVRFFRI